MKSRIIIRENDEIEFFLVFSSGLAFVVSYERPNIICGPKITCVCVREEWDGEENVSSYKVNTQYVLSESNKSLYLSQVTTLKLNKSLD